MKNASQERGRRRKRIASSPSSRQVEYLVIGQIVAPRGVHGELKVRIETEDPERFYDLQRVYLGEEHRPFEVTRARLFKGQALLRLEGVDDRDAAEVWRGSYVQVHIEDALPLREDEYYHYQLQGLAVVSVGGETLGHVSDIIATGANDVYIVRGERGEILIPAIRDVVLSIDLDSNTMIVRLPEGL